MMLNVSIFFHYGGTWVEEPELNYKKQWTHYWRGYDPDLISFDDLVNEFNEKLGFISVRQLIISAPSQKFYEIQGDEGVRKLLSLVSDSYYVIHLYAVDDCQPHIDVPNIVVSDGSFFLLLPIVRDPASDDSDSDSDRNGFIDCPTYDTNKLNDIISRKKRVITESLDHFKELTSDMTFKDIPEARKYCKLYALANKKELVNKKSDPDRVRYECADPGCPFVIYIRKETNGHGASVITLIEHVGCEDAFDNAVVDHSTIALYFKNKIQNNPKYKVKDMRGELNTRFNLNTSQGKCQKAKKDILEVLEGSFLDSYNKLEAYANELLETNPGSDIVINLSKDGLAEGRRKFLRMYICFNAMKLGFKGGLRPLIGLDGTFLRGKTKGQLLVAVGMDNMNHFYPLAWAVVGKENTRNWTWFMQHLQQSLDLKLGEGMTFISDMQKGLLQAVQNVLPEAHQRYCVRHIEANWCKRWGKGELKKLLWWCAWSSYSEEFNDHLEELKQFDEGAGVELISRYSPKSWCRAFFDTICKNQMVDNNFTESFNSWILEARHKPIIGMLEDIRVKVMKRLDEMEKTTSKWRENSSLVVVKLYDEYVKIAHYCQVVGNGDMGYEVTEGCDRHIVSLREKRCTCRTWDLTGIPCPHAIKAMLHKKMTPKNEIHWYHSKEAFLLTYKYKLQPVGGQQLWKVHPSQAIEPPEMIKQVGRPKMVREREKDEALKRQGEWKKSRKGTAMRCSTCGEQGHNMRSCKKAATTKKQQKQGKQQKAKKQKVSIEQPLRRLVDEEDQCEEDINLTAPEASQNNQQMASSSRITQFMDDDDEEDPSLWPKVVDEDAFITRLQRRQRPREPTGTRGIDFRGGKDGVNEPSNLPIEPTGLMWKGKAAMTNQQLEADRVQKLRPRRGPI